MNGPLGYFRELNHKLTISTFPIKFSYCPHINAPFLTLLRELTNEQSNEQ